MGFAAWIAELLGSMAEISLLSGPRRRRPDVVALDGVDDAPAARYLGRNRTLKG